MALRNLSDGKRLGGNLDALEDVQRRADSLLSEHGDTPADSGADSHQNAPKDESTAESEPDTSADESLLEVEIQLPAPSVETDSDSQEPTDSSPPQSSEPSKPADPFLASLEALRRTLRQPTPVAEKREATAVAPQDVNTPQTTPRGEEAPRQTEVHDAADTSEAEATPSESASSFSALESIPLPETDRAPTPLPQLTETQSSDTPTKTPPPKDFGNGPSLDAALDEVRSSIGLSEERHGSGRRPSTPRPRKRRPLSDGIPKSVSEDLPKFRGKPRMRICNRCGHETKLRSPECQNCGKVDESLGILDAVISGDIAKVEQILLVRPHLISVRTSRHEWTLLHMAASGGNRKMLELLIGKGAAVNATNRDGKTALHYAAGKGHLNVVESLLAHHADVDLRYHEKSAADLAREHGQSEVEMYLRNLAKTDANSD